MGRHGHEHVLFLEARRNKKVYEQCDMSRIKDEEDKNVEDDNVDHVDIIKGLESASML